MRKIKAEYSLDLPFCNPKRSGYDTKSQITCSLKNKIKENEVEN
jgi:hypothetical protein